MDLQQLGWNSFFAQSYIPDENPDHIVGRVACVERGQFLVYTPQGESWATLTGKFRYQGQTTADFPTVGDWVILHHQQIQGILPRQSQLSRQSAGQVTAEQLIAANINTVFLVTGLDGDFNLSRLERYLLVIWESGANPVIVLNKADLCEDLESYQREVSAIAPGIPLYALSATHQEGLEALHPHLKMGQTVALIGSSGVGKSTLTNQLLGRDRQATQAVRAADSHGRHTTTRRELIPLPTGGLLIDTPGMRELQLWQAETGLSNTFADIEALTQQCRFRNCQHETEPNCAVKAALQEGILSPKRWQNYQKLQREAHYNEVRQNSSAQQLERAKWKKIHKMLRQGGKG